MLLLLKMRVVFADDACLICLTPFIELLDVHKITFATCQHTVCMSCLSKHLMSETTMKTMTPCCRQNFNLCITAQDSVEESFLKTFCLGPSHRMPIDLFCTMYMNYRHNQSLELIAWNLNDFEEAFRKADLRIGSGSHWWINAVRTGTWLYGIGFVELSL